MVCLPVLSADSLGKQFGSRSGTTWVPNFDVRYNHLHHFLKVLKQSLRCMIQKYFPIWIRARPIWSQCEKNLG